MSARLQTWFPCSLQVALNGRTWLRHGSSEWVRDYLFDVLDELGPLQGAFVRNALISGTGERVFALSAPAAGRAGPAPSA